MPGYGAYGVITSDGITRTPFLLEGASIQELAGTTSVAVTDGATQPDLLIHIEIVVGLSPPTGGGSGNGFRVYMSPQPETKVLTDLQVRVVIINPLNSAGVGTQVQPGQQDPYPDIEFYVLEYDTTGATPMPPLVMFQLAQLTQVTTKVSGPSDTRLDDEIAIEMCEPHGLAPLQMQGGTATGPTVTFPGKLISNAGGAYSESDTTIRGIDLSRIEDTPPATATSPASATWFQLGATVPPATEGTQTHMKLTIRTPHTAPAPSAPTASNSPATGSVIPGNYDYAVSFVHPNGNETPLSNASDAVNLSANGAVEITNIDTGPATPTSPELGIVARRIYRRGPTFGSDKPTGDQLLVGELPGPQTPSPPAPLPTNFTDTNSPIDLGGGQNLAAGQFRYPSRLSVRYTADTPLDLIGGITLVNPGTGSANIQTYQGTIDQAATEVLVVNDDRASLLPSLQPAVPPLTRLQWTANASIPHVTIDAPGQSTPFGAGAQAILDDTPSAIGIDWGILGGLITTLDVRGETSLAPVPDPAPAVGSGGPDPIPGLGVILGSGQTPSAWPNGEATVGVDTRMLAAGSYATIAARGLRWAQANLGDGSPPPYHPNHVTGTVLLGPDPSNPPGGERTLRVFGINNPTAQGTSATQWWGRAGVLPDRVDVDFFPYSTGDPPVGTTIQATLTGAIERLVGQVITGPGAVGTDAGAGDSTPLTAWASIVRTGDPTATPAPQTVLYADNQNIEPQLPEPWAIEAALSGVPLQITSGAGAATTAAIDAQLRLPTTPVLSLANNQYTITPSPDGTWGRGAVTWNGDPVATRSNPQVRIRNRPPATQSLEGVTVRILGLSGASVTQVPPTIDPTTGDFADPVSKVIGNVSLTGPRPNGSLRFEAVEIDPRFQPQPRTAWKVRIGSLPDELSGEVDSNNEPNDCNQPGTQGPFYITATTSAPITDGVLWGEPLAIRPYWSPRLTVAGVQNYSALIATLPTSLTAIVLGAIPAQYATDPQYAAATIPSVHSPPMPVQAGGVRVEFGGPLSVSGVRVATFMDDDYVCLDKNTDFAGYRSIWQEIIVPLLNVNFDPSADISADPTDAHRVWIWLYTQPPPPCPPSGPPPDPCNPPNPPSLTNGYAFRIGDGLLIDLALRVYQLRDSSISQFRWWNGFVPGTDIDGTPIGTWLFKEDVQMQGYRGEITMVASPSKLEEMGNPYGDWQAGPGLWYVRARDMLSLVVYTGDLYMGNTGHGWQVPFTNGIFSTLAAIYNITWPS